MEGRRHGKGFVKHFNGDTYKGEFRDGKKEGKGRFTFAATGDEYEGECRENMRHGEGKYTFGDGLGHYEGTWVEDVKCGEGKVRALSATSEVCVYLLPSHCTFAFPRSSAEPTSTSGASTTTHSTATVMRCARGTRSGEKAPGVKGC